MRLLVLIILFAALPARGQVETLDLVPLDAARGDRPVPLRVVYDPAAPPGPVVVLGHAYLTEPRRYDGLAARLAGAGCVVATPGTEMTLLADQRVFAEDLRFALAEVRRLGALTGSPLAGRVTGAAAVAGHSLGGAAALRAATRGDFDALVTLAVLNEATAPVAQLADRVAVPTLMIAALADCVTPRAEHESPVWENLGVADRAGLDLAEGSHCGFAAPDPECLGAEGACAATPEVMTMQRARVGELVAAWLRSRLLGDAGATQRLARLVAADAAVAARSGTAPAASASWGGIRARYR